MAQQFDLVRASSEEERKRTSETLRNIYEQVVGDSDTLFRQASERFSEIVQGMRQMATEMQRELESTRGELRRGILELPQETAESAAQMRRVIVDQIEALAELNRIVARHGRGLDVSDPARRSTEPALTAVAGGRAEAPRAAPARAEAPRSVGRRAEAPALTPGHSPGGNGRSGWLSDILQRASRDDLPPAPPPVAAGPGPAPVREGPPPRGEAPRDERSARYTIESLDSLSVDIARMINHDAAAELWDRYKRGERNVFTRQLYTLQGQKAFEEIRKKYRADGEFRQTVDRYIQEFERLLDEVSRGDRGQVVARTYLTSETGKVYTMLAHAAGRFGE
jgi:hypothetical protein